MTAPSTLAETFAINNRINLYLLNAIDEKNLSATYAAGKSRTVGKQWAHIHQVRMMWLKAAAPDLLQGLAPLTETDTLQKQALHNALVASGRAMEQLLSAAALSGKVKGFKPHATAFLGYLLAHEGHHRGQIMVALKENGQMVDKKIQFGLWEWGVR